MPLKPLSQTSFFSPDFADPGCIVPGTVAWLIREYSDLLLPRRLFADWSGQGRRGRNGWPPRVLMAALWLRAEEGVRFRRAMVERLRTDTRWRAAAGLEIGGDTPDEATFRRFEKYLRRRDRNTDMPRYLLLHEYVVRLCLDNGVVGERACWAMDSTPMWCFGAVRGTVRLLGDGLRGLCKRWARAVGATVADVAHDWDVPMVLAKSTKGFFRADWRQREARARVVDEIARTVIRVVELVRGRLHRVRRNKRKGLLRRCRHLLRVVATDLEADEDGRLVVAHGTARDRLVSITDPQARHSRKTKSRPFNGFRLHVLGDMVSGLIASVSVTPANRGDAHPAPRLIKRARRLCSDIEMVLGDTAYGGAELHERARTELDVDVLAPPIPIRPRKGAVPSSEFNLDLEQARATCPAGTTVEMRIRKSGDRYFRWPAKVCRECPLRPGCFSESASSRVVNVSPRHEELCKLRERWEDPAVREAYRERSQCERLINESVRRGGRQANAWGLGAAVLQAHTIATRCNLALLAKALAARADKPIARAA